MLNAIGLLLRLYSYLFHLILCLFLLGIDVIAWSTGKPLNLGMLPWSGQTLSGALFALGIAGLLSIFLAVTGFIRWLFPLWNLLALILMFRGFLFSSYSFSGGDAFKNALWLLLAAAIAFLGSLTLFGRRRRR